MNMKKQIIIVQQFRETQRQFSQFLGNFLKCIYSPTKVSPIDKNLFMHSCPLKYEFNTQYEREKFASG